MKKFWRAQLALGVALAVILMLAPLSSAATSGQFGPGNSLQISPVVFPDLTIVPGSSQTIVIYVTNLTAQPARFQTIVNDFTAGGDESGLPAIILNPDQYAASHSLKRFVQVPPDFDLAPHQQKAVDVTISVPKGTAGGGYYGVVRFISASATSGGGSVALAASTGPLVLLKVPGNLDENLSVASFTVDKGKVTDASGGGTFFTNGSDLSAVVRFQNNGNIQEAPFGNVVLKHGGQVLETRQINTATPPGVVLPSSIRRFAIPLNKVGNFGKFTVEGNFGYGTSGQLLSVSKTFYVIPLALIIAAAIIIVLIIIGIILGRKELRRHDRKLLARFRSQSGRSAKRRR